MGALSTIKNNSGLSDSKTDAIIRNQILSGGRNGQSFEGERGAEKRGQVLTSLFEEAGPSTKTLSRQKQFQSSRDWNIEEQTLDSTDLQGAEGSPELGTESNLDLERASRLLMEELSETLLEHKFRRLVEQWRGETLFISSSTEKMMHPSYQRIIGMGPAVVPLLLRELQERGGHWFWALRAITEEDPVNPEDVGRVRKMTEAWLQWGKQHNLL